jgi:putative FmdB family regulatory protein
MPLYEYECPGCGGFSAWGAMAGSAAPAPCPTCGASAGRVLSATAVSTSGGRRRPSPGAEPRLVERTGDPPPAPKPVVHHSHGRPWMMGH